MEVLVLNESDSRYDSVTCFQIKLGCDKVLQTKRIRSQSVCQKVVDPRHVVQDVAAIGIPSISYRRAQMWRCHVASRTIDVYLTKLEANAKNTHLHIVKHNSLNYSEPLEIPIL
jgi:hypothetical protein